MSHITRFLLAVLAAVSVALKELALHGTPLSSMRALQVLQQYGAEFVSIQAVNVTTSSTVASRKLLMQPQKLGGSWLTGRRLAQADTGVVQVFAKQFAAHKSKMYMYSYHEAKLEYMWSESELARQTSAEQHDRGRKCASTEHHSTTFHATLSLHDLGS